MAHPVVTFDGPNRIITEISALGDNELDWIEIYSEWKVWVTQSDNSKFLQAINFVGGDPISPTQNLGSTFFLENGWRVRPAELSHKLTVVGNVFTREPGESIFVATLGAFTVNTETRVSSLVDSSVSRLDLTQLLQAVYIAIGGATGTGDTVGTPTNPSDNVTDARTIADRDNLQSYQMRGSFSLDQDHEFWQFNGLAATFADIVNIAGFSVDNSRFSQMTLTGAMTGSIECDRCNIEILTGLTGILRRCGLNQSVTLAALGETILDSCFSTSPGSVIPIITMTASSHLNIRNYSGDIQINSCEAGNIASIDLDPGHLVIDSSCTGGMIIVRGIGRLTNNGAAGVTVIDAGFLDASEFDILYHAIAGNADVNITDTQIEIRDEDMNLVRTLSVSVDGRIRRIV